MKMIILIAMIVGLSQMYASANSQPRCVFDRNEPAPKGWWWDVYKCSDGTERRQLVASPRG